MIDIKYRNIKPHQKVEGEFDQFGRLLGWTNVEKEFGAAIIYGIVVKQDNTITLIAHYNIKINES